VTSVALKRAPLLGMGLPEKLTVPERSAVVIVGAVKLVVVGPLTTTDPKAVVRSVMKLAAENTS
jgi:hypothetical protein